MIEVFDRILNTEEEKRIALVGFGNLGKALKHNNFRRNANLNIVCVFDNDPAIVGKEIEGVMVYPMDRFSEIVEKEGIKVAISTVPSKYSQAYHRRNRQRRHYCDLELCARSGQCSATCSYAIHRSDN